MRRISIANTMVAMLFVVALFLPLAGLIQPGINIGPELVEKRAMSERPSLDRQNLRSFPRQYEKFFNDHFGFRSLLIRWNNFHKFRLFGIVPGDKVYAGKGGWLFFRGSSPEDGYPALNHAGGLPDNNNELFPIIRQRLAVNREFLARMGIGYLLVVVPDKWSIYPEYVPDGFDSPTGHTTVEALVDYLRSTSDLDILDVRTSLMKAKSRGLRLYDKGDTHWNDLGALVATQAIMAGISEWFAPLPTVDLAEFTQHERRDDAGDLVSLMGLDGLIKNRTMELEPRSPVPYDLSELGEPPLATVVSDHRTLTQPRVVIIRDSFSNALIPLLSRCFGQTYFIWERTTHRSDMTLAFQDIRPDFVVEIKVERLMLELETYFHGARQLYIDEHR